MQCFRIDRNRFERFWTGLNGKLLPIVANDCKSKTKMAPRKTKIHKYPPRRMSKYNYYFKQLKKNEYLKFDRNWLKCLSVFVSIFFSVFLSSVTRSIQRMLDSLNIDEQIINCFVSIRPHAQTEWHGSRCHRVDYNAENLCRLSRLMLNAFNRTTW